MTIKKTLALFTYTAQDWVTQPGMAFDAFLAGYRFEGRNLRASSFVVYRGMFMRLHEWLGQQDKTLFSLNEKLINEFLNSRTLSAESRHRYLLLYTTLLAHLADFKGAQDNPAHALLLEQEAPERENPEWLTAAEAQAFLTTAAPGSGWKQLRNRALAHTVLGTGLHSSEVLSLKLSDLNRKRAVLEAIWVRSNGPRPSRVVPVQRFALTAMKAWLEERTVQGLPGTLVFPASSAGGPISPATLFRQVRATLVKAGISRRYEGPTLLRNTCGALWLSTHPAPQVMQWMGHATLRTTELLSKQSEQQQAAKVQDLATVKCDVNIDFTGSF